MLEPVPGLANSIADSADSSAKLPVSSANRTVGM